MIFTSVIIPFNKGKRYLKDCLNSLNEENLSDIEIILIINGNQEDINDLLKNHDNLNIIVKSFDYEMGVGKARNEGLKIATGKYIYFMDSDDYLFPNSLSKLIDVAHKTNGDFINGERINTPFIKDRFEEIFEEKYDAPLKQDKLSDFEFAISLLVGKRTNHDEVLSVLNSLIKKDVIEDNEFIDSTYHCDYDFIIDIMDNINSFYGVENAVYAKRIRDDPINSPSLNQEMKNNSPLQFYEDYKRIFKIISNKNEEKYNCLKLEMVKSFYNYYCKVFIPNFLDNPDNSWRGFYFDTMVEISKDFNLISINFFRKKEIKALQSKNKSSFRKLVKIKSNHEKIVKMFKTPWRFKTAIYNKIYNKNKIKDNQILFESFRGDFYSDSPKYLYEYLYEHYSDDFEFVWVINDFDTKIPGNPKKVKRFSLEYYKEWACSKYIVINGRQNDRLTKKTNQIYISTWHGTPLKKLGLDIGNVHSMDPNIKKSYIHVGKEWDYLISPNEYSTNILKSAFAYDGEILEMGYPRNDILYNADEKKINHIKYDLELDNDKKIILYAPTWRDDEYYGAGQMKFQLKLDLAKLKESLGDEYIILLRTHYFIADHLDLSGCEGFAYDVSKYNDIAELYLISDILITDYSSVFFDFANLKKPILYYTYDLEKYESLLRGFYIDIRNDVPGPLLKTTEEVIGSIKNIESLKEEYAEKYEIFYNKFCSLDDGNASKRIVKRIWNK